MFKNAYRQTKSALKRGAVTLGAGVVSVSAHAAGGPDFTGMTGQIDWTTAIAALLLVAGGLAGVYVVMTGSGLINQKIKSGK
jgi:hypothetical protein